MFAALLPTRSRFPGLGSRAPWRRRWVALATLVPMLAAGGMVAVPPADAGSCDAQYARTVKLDGATMTLTFAFTCRSVDVWGTLSNPTSQTMTGGATIAWPPPGSLLAKATVTRGSRWFSSGWQQVNQPGGVREVTASLMLNRVTSPSDIATVVLTRP